jgi:hypothetical protein
MRALLKFIYHSFFVQLFLLHFRKYQILLVFWLILFSIVSGAFMQAFGTHALFLAPEYLGDISILSTAIVGVAFGVFIMSWNITTFILHTKYFTFLAATRNPFVKYCLNNSFLPLAFFGYYLYQAYKYGIQKELMNWGNVTLLAIGFILGFVFIISITLLYFFGADRQIIRKMQSLKNEEEEPIAEEQKRIYWFRAYNYLTTPFKSKPCRSVAHYDPLLIESIFKRHHLTGIILVFVAFVIFIILGFLLDNPFFQLPAAANIILMFALLVAALGGLSYFLQSWSIPFLLVAYLIANYAFQKGIIDPTNKAFGLNYSNKPNWPAYNKDSIESLCKPEAKNKDLKNFIAILEKWRAKQKSNKPKLVIINTSGGGLRSSNFTTQILQQLDTTIPNGLMPKTAIITGASGGMLGATYCREIFRRQQKEEFLQGNPKTFVHNISKDLLNSLTSSLVVRDLIAPAQKFEQSGHKYVKDRAYAFEENLNSNVGGILNGTIGDYYNEEKNAEIPLTIFSSTITRDSRKLILSSQPLSFAMQPWQADSVKYFVAPDAVDYQGLFKNQNPNDLRILTALRMNATFPYALPNVWLPTNPIIDVMDAGLRDNYGTDITLRLITYCKKWILENTSGVVLIQIRDRENDGDWNFPFEISSLNELVTRPMLQLQFNQFKTQQFQQNLQLNEFKQFAGIPIETIAFQYTPTSQKNRASLSFHLTPNEMIDITAATKNEYNTVSMEQLKKALE